MYIKRWESPRRSGRNDKGKGGSARQRQLKKRDQQLRQKLKQGSSERSNQSSSNHQRDKRPSFFCPNFNVS